MLKRLIRSGCSLLGRDLTTQEAGVLKRHRLDRLWAAFMPILLAVSKASAMEPPPSDQLAGVESYISQMTAIDPESYSFRYVYSIDGTPSEVQEITHLNLLVFVSYDNVSAIRALYPGVRHMVYDIGYSARSARKGSEIMFFCEGLKVPSLLGPYGFAA